MDIPSTSVEDEKKKIKNEMKAVKTCALVLGIFLLSWIPYMIVVGLQMFCGMSENRIVEPVRGLFACLTFVNSAVNPFIYAVRMKHFRAEAKKIFRVSLNTVNIHSADNE